MAAIAVKDGETISRLLQVPAMLDDSGKILSNAFATGKLTGTNGESVDRCDLLGKNFHRVLAKKASAMSGYYSCYCLAKAEDIRAIRSQANEQLFDVLPDPLDEQPANPWDHAHAKLVAMPGLKPSDVRGHRDELLALFEQTVQKL